MRTFSFVLATLVFALPVLRVAHAANGPVPTCRSQATVALDDLAHARFADAVKYFSPEADRAALAGKLEQGWIDAQKQVGAYRGHAPAQDKTIRGKAVVVTRVEFAKAPLDMLVACDAQGRLVQLRFLDPAMLALATQQAAPQAAQARVEADGVRMLPLDVPSPAGPLHGAITLPAGAGPFPAVVMVAGSGAHDMDEGVGPNKPFRNIAEGLARQGVASLRYDKRTFDHPKTWGAGSGQVIDSEVTDDAVAAVHRVATQQGVDPSRVFVLGHSLGAMMAPRIARRDPRLAGLVLLAAPARPILDVIEQQSREQSAKQGLSAAAIEQAAGEIRQERTLLARVKPGQPGPKGEYDGAPQGYWLSWSQVDPLADAAVLSVPIFIAQGGRDFQVSPTLDFARWRQALASRSNVAFHLYPSLSHLFMPAGTGGTVADYLAAGHVDGQVIGDIAAWIKAQPSAQR